MAFLNKKRTNHKGRFPKEVTRNITLTCFNAYEVSCRVRAETALRQFGDSPQKVVPPFSFWKFSNVIIHTDNLILTQELLAVKSMMSPRFGYVIIG